MFRTPMHQMSFQHPRSSICLDRGTQTDILTSFIPLNTAEIIWDALDVKNGVRNRNHENVEDEMQQKNLLSEFHPSKSGLSIKGTN